MCSNSVPETNTRLFSEQFHIWHIETNCDFLAVSTKIYLFSKFDSESVNVCDHKQAASIFTKYASDQRIVLISKAQGFSHWKCVKFFQKKSNKLQEHCLDYRQLMFRFDRTFSALVCSKANSMVGTASWLAKKLTSPGNCGELTWGPGQFPPRMQLRSCLW